MIWNTEIIRPVEALSNKTPNSKNDDKYGDCYLFLLLKNGSIYGTNKTWIRLTLFWIRGATDYTKRRKRILEDFDSMSLKPCVNALVWHLIEAKDRISFTCWKTHFFWYRFKEWRMEKQSLIKSGSYWILLRIII